MSLIFVRKVDRLKNCLLINNIDQLTMKLHITPDINSTETYQKLFAKLQNPDVNYQNFVKNLAKYQFQVNAVIQDILGCNSMDKLNALNEKGRALLSTLREELDSLDLYGRESGDEKFSVELEAQKHLMAGLLREFRDANVNTLFNIEKAQREELLKSKIEGESNLRNRKRPGKKDGLSMSSGVTEQLLAISRQLADTTQRSQATLDTLVSSSSAVHGTQSELENTAGTISQSSKLLNKYGRREFTDKVIMFFAFLFFLAVCLYIVQKRLF
ncbi:vesicle transport protein SEC20 [Papilio machaon]|nr:vesicle transport protein SEC20 [Papilio machaon]